jgi:rhamnose transport system substrate-binding protein
MRRLLGSLLAAAALALIAGSARAEDTRIAMVVKALGIGFFEAARDGGQEAAKEIGGVELIYTGPAQTTAEAQIEVINSLIAQRVDAMAISANDTNALVPIAKKAMERGIKVISWDSGIAPEGRIMQLDPSNIQLIGATQVKMMAKTMGGEGEFAILSAASNMTNQNAWIAAMKEELQKPEYAKMKLVTTVYGDDLFDKSYREALGLFKSYPDLEGIIAPTSVGIVAAAKAVTDQNLIGKVHVTGLGLPSEMKAYVDNGATETFAIWNPIDLGYTATYLAYQLSKGGYTGKPGEEIPVGRMGKITIGADGSAAMAEPYIFDKSNIAKFAAMF